MRNKFISFLLLAVMATSSVAYAGPVEGNDNSGGGQGGGNVAGSTWNSSKSGYRISVIDRNKKVVATTVDYVYSTPNDNFGAGKKNFYTNTRFTGLSNSFTGYQVHTFKSLLDSGQINDIPKEPIYYSGSKLHAGGDLFKEWFLNGEAGMDITNVPKKPVYSSSGDKSVETGTSRPVSSSPNYQASGSV